MSVINTPTGRETGRTEFYYWAYNFSSEDLPNWQLQLEIKPYLQWGSTVGGSFDADPSCSGACTLTRDSFPQQASVVGQFVKGFAQWKTTISAAGAIGTASNQFVYHFNVPNLGRTTGDELGPPTTRCDNATPGKSLVGCVQGTYTPSLTFTETDEYCCPAYAKHIRFAQASGLPGGTRTRPLTRLTDPALIAANRSYSCKSSYPRPTGTSCDEYPIAASYQGGKSGGANLQPRTHSWCQIPAVGPGTGATGYSVCMIDAAQNSSAGGHVSSFMTRNRVINGDRFVLRAN